MLKRTKEEIKKEIMGFHPNETNIANVLSEKEKKFIDQMETEVLEMLLWARKQGKENLLNLPIYVITVFSKIESLKLSDGRDSGFPDLGSRCTWGFFYDKDIAIDSLNRNVTDMWETCYDYAVLEKVYPGVPFDAISEPPQFFKYNEEKNGYFMIPTPTEPVNMKQFMGYSFG